MAIYAKLENDSLSIFKNPLIDGDTMHFNPSEQMLRDAGYKVYISDSLDVSKQDTCDVRQNYVENDTEIKRVYEYVFNPDKTQKYMTDAIQEYMDMKAQELGYDNINSACTYINTGVAKFDTEGDAFRQWRSAVWAFGYDYLDKAMRGEASIPSRPEEVIALLPELTIVYEKSEEQIDDDIKPVEDDVEPSEEKIPEEQA